MDLYNAIAECLRQEGYIINQFTNGNERVIVCEQYFPNGRKVHFSMVVYTYTMSINIVLARLRKSYDEKGSLERLNCLETINHFNKSHDYVSLIIENIDGVNTILGRSKFPVMPDNINYSPNDAYVLTIIRLCKLAEEDFLLYHKLLLEEGLCY